MIEWEVYTKDKYGNEKRHLINTNGLTIKQALKALNINEELIWAKNLTPFEKRGKIPK